MIRISEKTQKRMKELGDFGQSYDDLVNEALDALEEQLEEDEDEEIEDEKEG